MNLFSRERGNAFAETSRRHIRPYKQIARKIRDERSARALRPPYRR
jgi:hypothetical protein